MATASDLRAWLDVCLDETLAGWTVRRSVQAWQAFRAADWDALVTLDEELTALRPSSSARRSSRAMGRRLLKTWQALHPGPRSTLEQRVLALCRATSRLGPTLPVAFAGACACCGGIDRRRAVEAFAYTRLAATISAAMRLMPIGQPDAHALLDALALRAGVPSRDRRRRLRRQARAGSRSRRLLDSPR